MVINCACIISNLKIKVTTPPFYFNNLHLIDSPELIDSYFLKSDFLKVVGVSFYNQLRKSVCFFGVFNIDDFALNEVPLISQSNIDMIDAFCCGLWFVKDNSCDAAKNYTLVSNTEHCSMIETHTVYSDCQGGYEDTFFSFEELKSASEIINKLLDLSKKTISEKDLEILKKSTPMKEGMNDGISNIIEYNGRNRIERAYLFLRAVRQTNFILLKIALYMNILECLFTTDSSEVAHKISERVAHYYSDDLEERKKTFKLIKKTYGIRSKYFHGQSLDRKIKMESIKELLKDVDALIRAIFLKVVMVDSSIFLKDNDDLEAYFTDLIFK